MPIPRDMEGWDGRKPGQNVDSSTPSDVRFLKTGQQTKTTQEPKLSRRFRGPKLYDDYGAATQALMTPTFESTHQSLVLEACCADIV